MKPTDLNLGEIYTWTTETNLVEGPPEGGTRRRTYITKLLCNGKAMMTSEGLIGKSSMETISERFNRENRPPKTHLHCYADLTEKRRQRAMEKNTR